MRAIRSKDTKPEVALRAALDALDVAHEPARKGMPGSPDVTVPAVRLAVFVHGCFWHQCPRHFKMPKSRVPEWTAHFERNRLRDSRVSRRVNRMGWHYMVVWEHEDADVAASRVLRRVGCLRSQSRSNRANERAQSAQRGLRASVRV